MNIDNAIRELRETADQLEQLQSLRVELGNVSLSNIFASMRDIRPTGTLSVELQLWQSTPNYAPTAEWTIWDGANHSKGDTLGKAFAAFRQLHTAPAANSLEEAIAEVEGAA